MGVRKWQNLICFNTQPPEGGWYALHNVLNNFVVSTHSRLKAAGPARRSTKSRPAGFNTQPPEGGWWTPFRQRRAAAGFNTQPPEGGWDKIRQCVAHLGVSTHSRLKAAGSSNAQKAAGYLGVSTHSRLKAAGLIGVRPS